MSVTNMLVIFFCGLIFVVTVKSQALEEGSDCITPDNRRGVCTDIRACDDLLKLLRTRSKDPVAVDFLRSSTCGFRGSFPLLCCELKAQPIPTAIPTAATTRGTTPRPTTPTPSTTTKDPEIPSNNRTLLPRYPNCGISKDRYGRIVGGRPANLGEFPWIVALGYKNAKNPDTPKWLCGGSLITRKHVLTAGHCVSKRSDLYLVRAGDLDLYDPNDGASPVDVGIAKVKLHEDYNPSSVTNDIAIITLKREVYGELIDPVCLPLDEPLLSRNFVGYTPIVSGWGAIYFNGPSSSRLQAVMLPVVRPDQCKAAYTQFKNVVIDDRVLCAGYLQGKKDSCQGDSGGPLITAYGPQLDVNVFYQIGVVSYGFRCAAEGYPGVYTRVTRFLDWIQTNVQ